MKKLVLLFSVLISIAGTSIAQMNSGHQQNPPATIKVENQFNMNRASGCNFLVFMDNLPWGSSAIQNILTANGETFSIATSSQMATIDFSLYDVIIIASDQVPQFYLDFAASFPKFVTFVTNGGSLEVHAATCGWNSPCGTSVQLPGGVSTVENALQTADYNNIIVNAAHPIVAGVSDPFYGSYASHGWFANLQAGTDIITETQLYGNQPTTIQYSYGSGTVTATMCTYEFGYDYGQAAGIMLQNNLNYSCQHHIDATTPISDWAIGIGIFLIIMAAFIRYKRLV